MAGTYEVVQTDNLADLKTDVQTLITGGYVTVGEVSIETDPAYNTETYVQALWHA